MSFQFRFDALLQLRRRQRDEAGADVGQAIEAIHRIDTQISEIRQSQESLRQQGTSARVGDLSVDRLLSTGRYDMQLQADVNALQETRRQLTEELDRRQQRLIEAESELKKFERLEENDRAAYDAQRRHQEQTESDEASARRITTLRQQKSHGHQAS